MKEASNSTNNLIYFNCRGDVLSLILLFSIVQMEFTSLILYIFIFIMAFMYASVGHGGASGYLAVLSLAGVSTAIMKPSVLLLNIFVSCISFLHYYRSRHFNFALFWPFAVASIPASYLGALMPLEETYYKKILGVCLLFSTVRLFIFEKGETEKTRTMSIVLSLFVGATIGFLSGMIGIGGGILLSPILLLLHWANMKQTAAVSALFIFVNSLSGMTALLSKGTSMGSEIYPILGCAIVGGYLGSYYGSTIFKFSTLKYLLTAVLVVASLKLLLV